MTMLSFKVIFYINITLMLLLTNMIRNEILNNYKKQ